MSDELKDKIIKIINSDKVKMKSKVHLALKSTLTALGLILATIFILYVASFIIFSLRASGALFAPAFGLRGVVALLLTAPWLMIAIGVALIVILEVLAKHFSFVYRRPILYSLLAIIALSTLGGVLIDQTDIHPRLFTHTKQNQLPIAGYLYNTMHHKKPANLNIGTVASVASSTILIQDIQNNTLTVQITNQTKFAPNLSTQIIKINDILLILGERNGEVIQATNIKDIKGKRIRFSLPEHCDERNSSMNCSS